ASIVKQQHEIDLAQTELERSQRLVQEGAGSQQDLDVRQTKVATTKATLAEAQASLQTANANVEVARATAATVQPRIADATLKATIAARGLYRLAEAGEVLPAGGKALTLGNMEDIYMEIFLPSEEAAAIKIGAEGRIVVDYDPNRAIAG